MKSICITAFLLFIAVTSNAQEFTNDKNASLISGAFSYSDFSGKTNGIKNKYSTIDLAFSYNYFLIHGFFVGGGISYLNMDSAKYYTSTIGIGPQLGYAFGNAKSKSFPYIAAGYSYINALGSNGADNKRLKGGDLFFGAGIILPFKTNFGMTVEAEYHIMNLNNDNSAKILSIGIGFVGILCKHPKE